MRALNDTGGESAVVKARVPDADVTRLITLARRRRMTRSQMTRWLIRTALDQLERGTGPPDTGRKDDDRAGVNCRRLHRRHVAA